MLHKKARSVLIVQQEFVCTSQNPNVSLRHLIGCRENRGQGQMGHWLDTAGLFLYTPPAKW